MGRVKSPYSNGWQRLVAELGEDGARKYMRSVRSKVNPKNITGGSFKDPKFAKKASALAVKARNKKYNGLGDAAEG